MVSAEALRRGCSNRQIISDLPVQVTVSVGMAWASKATELAYMLRVADAALYSETQRGRNCAVRAESLIAA